MRLISYVFVAVAALSAMPVFAQSGGAQSVEDFYLKQSVPVLVIREQAQSSDREGKLIALDYIRAAIDNGDKNDEIRIVLQDLALEGVLNKTRSEGRISNNYADVRMRAVEYLGEIGTKEASDALIKVVLVDDEPAVITEAFHSLNKIGINDNGRTLDTANWIFNRFNTLNTDNRLAISYLESVELFIPKMSQETEEERRIYQDTLDKVRGISSNYKYITYVRDRSKAVLSKLVGVNR